MPVKVLAWSLAVPVVIVLVLVALLVVIWPLPDLIAIHDVGTISGPSRAAALQAARDAARGRLAAIGAGVFAGVALLYTARNFRLSRQGQVTDRYAKAIEQLGSEELNVRIGGIYALERIARDSSRDYPTIMEVLAGFIRDPTEHRSPAAPGAEPPKRTTRSDVQAAAIVIGRRAVRYPRVRITLEGADLSGLKLQGADLIGAKLDHADLTGADLYGAKLIDAHAESVKLTRAVLTEANLSGAWLFGADLTGASLNSADLTGADLSDANLTGADLSGGEVPGMYASANLTRAILLGHVNLSGANLKGAKLTRALFGDVNLSGADLTGAKLTGVILSPTASDLTGALWPTDGAAIPPGWQQEVNSGRLKRTKY